MEECTVGPLLHAKSVNSGRCKSLKNWEFRKIPRYYGCFSLRTGDRMSLSYAKFGPDRRPGWLKAMAPWPILGEISS